jgi:hypothetical protein
MFNKKFLLGPNFQQKLSLGTRKLVIAEVVEESKVETAVVEITKPIEIVEKESKSSKT